MLEACTAQFTKWRRPGSAGNFCTQVHAGWLVACGRWLVGWLHAAEKNSPSESYFCSLCLITRRVILTDDLCVRRTWKIRPQKELEQDILFCRIDDSSGACGNQNNVQHCRAPCTVIQTSVVGDKRRLRFGFAFLCFPPQKRVPHLTFSLFWFCVCGYCLLWPSYDRLPSVGLWLLYMCGVQR